MPVEHLLLGIPELLGEEGRKASGNGEEPQKVSLNGLKWIQTV